MTASKLYPGTTVAKEKTSIMKRFYKTCLKLLKRKDKNSNTDKDADDDIENDIKDVKKDKTSKKVDRKSLKCVFNEKKSGKCDKTDAKDKKGSKDEKKDNKCDPKDINCINCEKNTEIQVDELIEKWAKPKKEKQKEKELQQLTRKEKELQKLTFKKESEEDEDEELNCFQFKIVEDDRKSERNNSQSSTDSGFLERDGTPQGDKELDDVLLDTLSHLKIAEEHRVEDGLAKKAGEDLKSSEKPETPKEPEKKKKFHTAVVARRPIKTKGFTTRSAPYQPGDSEAYVQITQVNRQTLSGGCITAKPADTTPDLIPDQIPDHIVDDYCGILDNSQISAFTGNAGVPNYQSNFREDLSYNYQIQNTESLLNTGLYYDNNNAEFTARLDQYETQTSYSGTNFINNILLPAVVAEQESRSNIDPINSGFDTELLLNDLSEILENKPNHAVLNDGKENFSQDALTTVDLTDDTYKTLPGVASVLNSNVEFSTNVNLRGGMSPTEPTIPADIVKLIDEKFPPDFNQIVSQLYDAIQNEKTSIVDSEIEFITHEIRNKIHAKDQNYVYPPSCLSENERSSNISNESFNTVLNLNSEPKQHENNALNTIITQAERNSSITEGKTDFEQLPNYAKMAEAYRSPSTNLPDYSTPYLTPPSSDLSPLPFYSPNYASGSENTPPCFYSPGYSKTPDHNMNSPQTNILSPGNNQMFQEISSVESHDTNAENKIQKKTGMPEFKKMQKQLLEQFVKKDCCKRDAERVSTAELFNAYSDKLSKDYKLYISRKVSRLDLKTIYWLVLESIHVLSSEAESFDTKPEEKHMHLFVVLCRRLLEDPWAFLGIAGFQLLEAAVLRCPDRPLLTRFIVECVRIALDVTKPEFKSGEVVFNQQRDNGDTLLTVCAKDPVVYGDVLAELLRTKDGQTPLFDINHRNSDGFSALHLSCRYHKREVSALYVVHLLKTHGHADLCLGDSNGNDSAVHMAVNSPTCDLDLVLLLFSNLDAQGRRNLAHLKNMSSKTPVQYARDAVKSLNRKGYPEDVWEFLKRCR